MMLETEPYPSPCGVAAWLMLSLFAILTVGCGEGESESTLERVQREGIVRIGYANEAPYAFLDPQESRLTGEAPEIARIVLERMGIEKIEGVLTEFGSLIPGLKAGRFDMIAAGMYITPERCREVAFSSPTYRMGEAFIVHAGNPKKLHGYEDVAANPEARLGVVSGTMEGRYAQAVGIGSGQMALFPDVPSALAGMNAGRIDAFAGTALTVQDMLAKAGDDGLERAEPFSGPLIDGQVAVGYGAFAFRKEDEALRRRIDQELAVLIGTGEHLAAVDPFGFGPEQLPGTVKAETLCKSTG